MLCRCAELAFWGWTCAGMLVCTTRERCITPTGTQIKAKVCTKTKTKTTKQNRPTLCPTCAPHPYTPQLSQTHTQPPSHTNIHSLSHTHTHTHTHTQIPFHHQ